MELTSKERINCAMNLQKPDRIPLICQFSIGSMMNQLQPDPVAFWYDKNVFAEGLIELCKKFRFDGILVSLHDHYDNWKDKLVKSEQIDKENIKLTFENRTEVHSLTDLPLIIFDESQIAPDIEEIDIDKNIPSVINYIPVSNNLHFNLDTNNLFDIIDIIYQKEEENILFMVK